MMDDFQKRVEDKLDKLDDKLESIHDRIHFVDITLAKQEANLETHMYRTKLAEENIALLRADVVPLQRYVAWVEGAVKLFGIFAVIAGLVAAFLRLTK